MTDPIARTVSASREGDWWRRRESNLSAPLGIYKLMITQCHKTHQSQRILCHVYRTCTILDAAEGGGRRAWFTSQSTQGTIQTVLRLESDSGGSVGAQSGCTGHSRASDTGSVPKRSSGTPPKRKHIGESRNSGTSNLEGPLLKRRERRFPTPSFPTWGTSVASI